MVKRHVLTALGVALVVAGIVLYVVSQPEADYGWFAYTPLSGESPAFASSADQVVLTRGRLVGVLLTVGGLLVVTAVVAYRLGRRRGRT